VTLQLVLSKPFPIDLLVLIGVALVSGFGWTVGAWLASKVLR
jgi:hypothetical protein